MKICHLTSAHPVKDVRIFVKECRSLQKAGHEVHLVVAGAEDQEIEGVKIHGVGKSKSRYGRMLSTAKKVYQKASSLNADVYHFHDPELLQYALPLKKKGKVIYDVHEDLPRQIMGKSWIQPLMRKSVAMTIQRYENRISKRLDTIITATPAIAERFLKLNKNTHVINNYPLLSELQNQSDWSGKQNEFSFIGLMSAIRGVGELVGAMGEVEATLNLAGKYAPEDFQASLQKKAGWEKVKEHGMLDRKEVADLLSRSLAGIVTFLPLPNHTSAQPNKMFEYMSAGIPVIASNFDLWKEVIEGNDCGICVNPEDPKEIAVALQKILSDKETAEAMGKRGRKAVEEKYNWEAEEKKLMEVYAQLG